MSHAELSLSRQKVAHLETMPSFLGILYGEVLRGLVLGDSVVATLAWQRPALLCVKHTLIHAELTHGFKILS